MNHDITSRADIDALMHRFYERAMADATIGHFFTSAMQFDLQHHLPVIGDFWESVLFGSGVYRTHGRFPLQIHADLGRKSPLEAHHFHRWLELFAQCVDDLFAGVRAEFTKQRSRAIAARMQEFIAVAEPVTDRRG